MIPALLVLALAVVVSVPLTARLGRAAGWPLAGLYLAATAAFWPTVREVMDGREPRVVHPWVPSLRVDLALRADGLSVVFGLMALVIGALVFIYSARYLGRGRHLSIYLVMALFTTAMLGLVLADNVYFLFVCWEVTSIASFLLIARSGRPGEHASMRTLLFTYTGGLALLVAVVLVVVHTGTTTLSQALVSPVWADDPVFADLVAVLVAVAGFSKAAQFPFHAWLPDAMAAPTPVSAYLHAAAVVKAGIFLLLRFSPAFHDTLLWNVLLVVTGLVTALLGARFALGQTDLKRLMAYSTVSQLGLMVATIGVGTQAAASAAILHVIAHALFKSGLFMMVGVVDHAAHTRDIRRLPPLWRAMPGAFTVTALGCAAMAGIPPLLGFVSKESIFTALLGMPGPAWAGPLALTVAGVASVLTFMYCGKVVFGGFVDGTDDRELEPGGTSLVAVAALPILVGLPLGLFAGVFDHPVGRATDAAVPMLGVYEHFGLWHGLTPELFTTLAVFAVGTWAVVRRRRLRPRLERRVFPVDGPEAIAALRRGATRIGGAVARFSGRDYASRHLGLIVTGFAASCGLGVLAVLRAGDLADYRPGLGRPLDLALLVLIAAAVVLLCRTRSRLAATVSMSAIGILATVQLLALGAPDVGLTQLLVETLTVVVIMLVSQRLPLRFTRRGRRSRSVVALALAAGLSAGAATLVLTGRRDRSPVGLYFFDNSADLTGGTNVVNVLLVEFRALDTAGELAVLGMAGVALVAVLSTVRTRHLDPRADTADPSPSAGPALRAPGTPAYRAIMSAWPNAIPLKLMLRVIAPILAIVSVVLFWRGHHEPGGGFIAALVAATIVGITYLSTARDRPIGPARLPITLIGGGIAFAFLVALAGLVVHGSLLEPIYVSVLGVKLASSLLFDVGVYAAVLGLVMLTFNILGTSETAYEEPGGEETRERVDQSVEGDLPGPLDTVRGERPPRPGLGTTSIADGRAPREVRR